jgi:hypothetical protein
MNYYAYPIPGQQANPTAFTADTTHVLGDVDKGVDSRVMVTVDYSQLIPSVTLTGYSFRVEPGGEPQLWIDGSTLGSPATSLTFYVKGGVSGVQYTVKVVATQADMEIRTDMLYVNVLGDADCAGSGCAGVQPSAPTNGAVSNDGSIITNTAPRFFVSATPPVGANVLDRYYNTTNGNVYDYVSTGLTTEWVEAGTGGGSGGGGGASNIIQMQPIFPDGVATTFTLTVSGLTVNIVGSTSLFVSVDGVWQQPVTQYQASGNQIIFGQAPSADSVIFMLWFAPPT